MPKRLTTSVIRALRVGTRASDGDGLFIENDKAIRYFGWRYAIGGRYRELRLGRWQDESGHEGITLTEARAKVAELRGGLAKGIDPKAPEAAGKIAYSFHDASEAFIEAIIVPTCKHNGEHASQWRQSLKNHCKPIMDMDVAYIGVDDVLACLGPIWLTKTPTASRLRGRIERILSYAKARGWRAVENPAIWREHLVNVLAAPSKVHRERNHAALDWRNAPNFIARLRETDDVTALALEFTMLTGVRSAPVLLARWGEIDLDAETWTIPALHEKTTKQHRVPLSDRAVAILRHVKPRDVAPDDVVFASARHRKQTRGHEALYKKMQKIAPGSTVHGLRACFSTWAKETGKSTEAKELALSHRGGNKVQRVYEREDLLDARRTLMQEWATHLTGAEIIELHRGVA
jgi:integrase